VFSKIKNLSKMIFFNTMFDAEFEIIREELTSFFLYIRNKSLAKTRNKENQEMTQTKD